VAVVRRSIREALKAEGVPPSCEVSVVLADDVFIRDLNREYMGVDAPTDVLSFPQEQPSGSDALRHLSAGSVLGDIVISIPTVERQAADHGHSFEEELALMAVHATLHLLGYDHELEQGRLRMWALQGLILQRMGLSGGAAE
jgi:probable rRNA maturation factor